METKDKIWMGVFAIGLMIMIIISGCLVMIYQGNIANLEKVKQSSDDKLSKCQNDSINVSNGLKQIIVNTENQLTQCESEFESFKQSAQQQIDSELGNGFISGCLNGCQKVIDKAKAEKSIDMSEYMTECQTYCRAFT